MTTMTNTGDNQAVSPWLLCVAGSEWWVCWNMAVRLAVWTRRPRIDSRRNPWTTSNCSPEWCLKWRLVYLSLGKELKNWSEHSKSCYASLRQLRWLCTEVRHCQVQVVRRDKGGRGSVFYALFLPEENHPEKQKRTFQPQHRLSLTEHGSVCSIVFLGNLLTQECCSDMFLSVEKWRRTPMRLSRRSSHVGQLCPGL